MVLHSWISNSIKSLDKPLHTDGLSTAQLLFPCLIELCDDFLGFLLVMEKQPALKMEVLPLLILVFIKESSHQMPKPLSSPIFSYLEPFNGFLTGRAKDAIVEVADGASSTG